MHRNMTLNVIPRIIEIEQSPRTDDLSERAIDHRIFSSDSRIVITVAGTDHRITLCHNALEFRIGKMERTKSIKQMIRCRVVPDILKSTVIALDIGILTAAPHDIIPIARCVAFDNEIVNGPRLSSIKHIHVLEGGYVQDRVIGTNGGEPIIERSNV